MYTNSLIINSLETEREKHFKDKLQNLLSYYPKERIVETHCNLSDMEDLFTDESINFVDMFHILIKKYYLSDVEETEINREFNKSIENLDFEYAHNWLLVSEELRKLVFYTYIDNINNPNNFLAVEKTYNQKYDEVNTTLEELNKFYLKERFNKINYSKTLKKSVII